MAAPSEDLADAALAWFEDMARDLPWRRPQAGAWGVLVSEIMLQQTPVARVLPVYEAWLARWPRPADLAAEPAGAAVRAWGRLGYPRRALRLHACAVAIVERHGGNVPDDVGALLTLPGVGTYTAHAVAAFAFGRRYPVVDTNVRRVLARAVRGAADAGPSTSARDLALAQSLLPADEPRAARASAAFMELGAVICTARSPRCGDCPLAPRCAWAAAGRPATPVPARRSQSYAGTDRQVRGVLLAAVRDADRPLAPADLDALWHAADQRRRALESLLADGLVARGRDGRFSLPG